MSSCCGKNATCLVYACSGGSNVGQLTTEAAKALDSAGEASMGCMAGLGGHVSGMVASAQSGVPVLILDGCSVACGKKIVEHLDLKDYGYVDITALGIRKEHNVNKTPNTQIEEVVAAARKEIARLAGSACSTTGTSCCS
ncbi:MAG TPA: putative zinc-binding protein [Candidatus Ozemobacteraceae bacterium]